MRVIWFFLLSDDLLYNLFFLFSPLFCLRDDGVAAEATIDFDASYIDSGESVKMWLGGLLFFATVFGLVALSGPTTQRMAVIPLHFYLYLYRSPYMFSISTFDTCCNNSKQFKKVKRSSEGAELPFDNANLARGNDPIE